MGKVIILKGEPFQLINQLKEQKVFDALGGDALNEMVTLFELLKSMNGLKNVIFDLSLARGLDYYTGLIQETVLLTGGLGSISGGYSFILMLGAVMMN